ncbi:MAG: class IV adenylate cyclase [Pirellulales bacterium]|nr:class IV adenylate cyclase [Pirellulales bacterium]
MKIEVEMKFPVADLAAIRRQLAQMGAGWFDARDEADTYYAHPARDFARTDEALRIRRIDTRSRITYKGPKLDTTTKSRREIELVLGDTAETADEWASLLEALGFRPVATVRKHRVKAHVPWQGRQVEASLDDVDSVGTFVEFELVAEDPDFDSARATIAALAEHLGLSGSQRRSYLQLLLERIQSESAE